MKVKVGVVGMGYWGRNIVRNFHELGALAAVCDSDPNREKNVTEQYPGTRFTTDIGDLLRDDSVRALAIAAPAAQHYNIAKQALEADKDIFVEKPLALEISEGEELVKLARDHGRILMVGHILRYHPAVRRLKELISDGELGQVRYIYSNRLNIGKIRTEENILWSFAPHDISVILALLEQQPGRVSCQGEGYLTHGVADSTLSHFTFPGGVLAHIFVSWLHPFKEQRLVVVGSEKMALFDDTAECKLLLFPHRIEWKNQVPTAIKAESRPVELPAEEPLRNECAHFLECVENRTTPLTDGEEGLRVLRLLKLCQQSLEKGGEPLACPQEDSGNPSKGYFAHPTAVIDEPVEIGEGTKIWHFSHIMKGAKIGKNCVLGQNVNVDGGAVVGNNVKVQNNVSIYTGLVIEDDVFLGPSCVLTNITNPRSQVNRHKLFEKTVLKRGASIGANATVVSGITVGRYAFIGAGAVVTKNVPDYAMIVGVPAKQAGWVSRHGLPLGKPDKDGVMVCPESGYRYHQVEPGILRCLDLDEDQPLPEDKRTGERYYDDIVHGRRLS